MLKSEVKNLFECVTALEQVKAENETLSTRLAALELMLLQLVEGQTKQVPAKQQER